MSGAGSGHVLFHLAYVIVFGGVIVEVVVMEGIWVYSADAVQRESGCI